MKSQQIRWLGAAILMPVLIGLSTASCEDTSIWDVNSMVGIKKSVCKADIDCDDKNDCTEDTCNAAGLCEYLVLPNANSCDDGNVCTVDRCDIYGRCQNELDTSIVAPSPIPCRRLMCKNGAPEEIYALDGDICGTETIPAGTGYCHQNLCISCNDGLKNGKETGQDCGGPDCSPCDDALPCNQNGDCLHGFCVEGLCCNNACDELCFSCGLPGNEGQCTPVPLNAPDDNPAPAPKCSFPYLCDGLGDCKATVGEGCASAGECLSGYCYGGLGICQIDAGDSCEGNAFNCYTDYCDAGGNCSFLGVNEICTFNDQCGPNRICSTWASPYQCKIADGNICDPLFPNQCATGYCDPNLNCKKAPVGYPCTHKNQCESNKCDINFTNTCLSP